MKPTLPITASELAEIAEHAASASTQRVHRLVGEIWRLRAKVRAAKQCRPLQPIDGCGCGVCRRLRGGCGCAEKGAVTK